MDDTQRQQLNAVGVNTKFKNFAALTKTILDQEEHDQCGQKQYPQQKLLQKNSGTASIFPQISVKDWTTRSTQNLQNT